MRQAFRALSIGVAMLVCSIVLDLVGSHFQSLIVLIVSFAFGIGGAVMAFRGLLEFFGEVL